MDIGEINKKIYDRVYDETREITKIVANGLIPTGPESFIPEDIFVNYFLPRFLNRVPNPGNWVVEWISIAGSPTLEVGIKGPAGEHLFTVPPLLYTKGLLQDKKAGNLGDIFERYTMMKNNLPGEGLRFLNGKLSEKTVEILGNYNIGEQEAAWMAILSRYGLIEKGGSGDPGSSGSQDLSDFFDYD